MRAKHLTTFRVLTLAALMIAGCASTAPNESDSERGADAGVPKRNAASTGPRAMGNVSADITNVLGRSLPSRIDLFGKEGDFFSLPAPNGEASGSFPEGRYMALVYVYSENIPILAEAKAVDVAADKPAFVLVNLLEGTTAENPLWRFDNDWDMAIDRVELALGTNPDRATGGARDVPGRARIPIQEQVISREAGWYGGELNAYSEYHASRDGKATNSVRQLIQRAEKAGLDFLAITDRNSIESFYDPAYSSDKVILIPALEWGDEERGLALIYAPHTVPELADSPFEAQAIARMIQMQGGVFVVARPCFPNSPWRWGLGYVNGIQVWCRDFRGVPPLSLNTLRPGYDRTKDGPLTDSLQMAANHGELSANDQAQRFWDYELKKGLKASVYGGSGSASGSVPIAEPITFVYAREKSLSGILEGMRNGNTYVTSGPNGPRIEFVADANVQEKDVRPNSLAGFDVPLGGTIPLNVPTLFRVSVPNAKGKRLEVLVDGRTILSKVIEFDDYHHEFLDMPKQYTVYRARIVEAPTKPGFGPLNILAMTSPIYAQEMYIETDNLGIEDMWVRLKNEYNDQPYVSPELDPASRDAYEIRPQLQFD